jgi:acyl-CoA thioesterase-1
MRLTSILAQIWCGAMSIETRPSARAALIACLLALCAALPGAALAADRMVLVAFGDSLTAGYGLAAKDAFPRQLERALAARGRQVKVVNAGVSGDTTSAGLARLDWAVPKDANAVIVELGANDALRGQDPKQAYAALDAIVTALKGRGLAVLLAGMEAPRNMGEAYGQEFNGIYKRLAEKHDVALYPFFLEGVAGAPNLNLPDGIHPTGPGVALIVERIVPHVEKLLDGVAAENSESSG